MAKKEKPTPCTCRICGRSPVVVRVKKNHWRVACPYLDCDPMVEAFGLTETDAVETWNAENGEEAEE